MCRTDDLDELRSAVTFACRLLHSEARAADALYELRDAVKEINEAIASYESRQTPNHEPPEDRMKTQIDIDGAVAQLSRSRRGMKAMRVLLDWLDDTGLGLDGSNQQACLELLCAAWGSSPMGVRDAMREALGE